SSTLEVLRKLRAEWRIQGMKALWINTTLSQHEMTEFKSQGVDAFLFKPIKALSLINWLDDMEKPRQPAPAVNEHKTPAVPLNVLVVDDSADNRMLMKEYLAVLGCRMTFAEGGYEAIEKYKRGSFDVVCLDINLADLNGNRIAEEIRDLERA